VDRRRGTRSRRRVVKLYGERNTGTNYLAGLLLSNAEVELLAGTPPPTLNRVRRRVTDSHAVLDLWFALTEHRNLGWKHRRVDVDALRRRRRAGRAHFVVTVKNPYSWLVSLQRRPYHRAGSGDGSLVALATEPWPTQRREGGPPVYDNAVRMWCDKAASHLALGTAFPTTIVRYEDLVDDPSGVTRRICDEAGLALLDDRVWNTERSTKRDGKTYEDYRDYYGCERWREVLGPEDIAAINRSLDADVMDALGYTILTPHADRVR
jgi:hypothetical protein